MIKEEINTLLEQEPYGVLCTQSPEGAFGYLMALAYSPDLKSFFLAASIHSRKKQILCQPIPVALVIDNRAKYPEDIMKVSVVTLTGDSVLLKPEEENYQWGSMQLAHRHPELKAFIEDTSTVLFQIRVRNYVYVSRFQEVRYWTPGSGA